jgi:LamB porin
MAWGSLELTFLGLIATASPARAQDAAGAASAQPAPSASAPVPAPAPAASAPAPAPAPAESAEPAPPAHAESERTEPADAQPAPPPPPAADHAASQKPAYPHGGFSFGSYGRVVVSSDARGGAGRDADFVEHGSRIDESTYAEIELHRDDAWQPGVTTRIVTTLAVEDPIFHYDGKFDASIALRNLYVEERGIGDPGLSVWIGSRMYRGDDIYLLDFWPLDNLNTVGGGLRYDTPKTPYGQGYVKWHVGMNRVDDPFQYQVVERPAAEDQPGETDVTLLDRPRVISSLKLGWSVPAPALGQHGGVKAALYGEVHRLPSGEYEQKAGVYEDLPGQSGVVVGAELGAYTGVRDTFINLFFRYATGLAAYGEFGTPTGYAADKTTSGAHEALIGLSANWEAGPFGVLAGGYFRSFRDASPEPYNFDNVDEGIISLRPNIYFTNMVGVAIEGDYEAQERGILDLSTNQPLLAKEWRFGVIPFLSPAGRGDYKRPRLRLIWAVTERNDDARALYPTDDVFAHRRVEQFLGIGAEWWFNSTSYGE